VVVPKAEKWDAPGILAAVKRKGETLTSLSRNANLYDSACRTSLTRPFPAADKVISDFLEVPLHELWPDRYEVTGIRIDKRTIRFREHNNGRGGSTHRQKDRAA
jgi:Ner family transcriptional regulator